MIKIILEFIKNNEYYKKVIKANPDELNLHKKLFKK